jgi:methanogenic corrinoid protein MtbC1
MTVRISGTFLNLVSVISDEIYTRYLSSLLSGSRSGCSGIVNDLIAAEPSIKELYVHLFQRSMYEVGLQWEQNRISVATEHMCTAITESMISLCYPIIFSAEHCGKSAVISCAPGEFHQIGARMVADYFELHGWDGYFLGSDTPPDELIKFTREHNPDLLAISMSVFFNLSKLTGLVEKIRGHFPNLTILVGGQGFRWGGADAFKGKDHVHLMTSLDDLELKYLT